MNVSRVAVRVFTVLAALAPVSALAAFQAPVTLSAAGLFAETQDVAVAPNGASVIVWEQDQGGGVFRIVARARSAAGVLGSVEGISSASGASADPQVALDDDGDGVVVWKQFNGSVSQIMTRSRSRTGALGAVQTVSLSGGDPQVALDADGDALIVWTHPVGAVNIIQARLRAKTGALAPVRNLSTAGKNAGEPRLAVGPNGYVTIWRSDQPGTKYLLQARTVTAAGVPGALRNISSLGSFLFELEVAVAADGHALIAWRRAPTAFFLVQARSVSKTGVVGPLINISSAAQNGANPEIGFDGNSNALIAWNRFDGGNFRVLARTVSKTGALGAIETISATGTLGATPDVSVAPDGRSVLVWKRLDGANSRIQARTRAANGALGPVQTLSAAGQDAFDPYVAVDSNAKATAVWLRSDGSNDRVQAAFGP